MAALPLSLLLLVLVRTPPNIAQDGEVGVTAPHRPTVAAIALSIRSRAIQDSRCYLMNGGAVESFYISEDTPVGSIIGVLSVNGDPSEEDGNISLRLQEKNAAVAIAPGSKNLTLLRALDREERLGPSNVYVNVRCDRRRTTDPSFIIPVSIRVWDVNDNAPVWMGTPYRIRLSELTAVGSRVLVTARATDDDQPGPHATIHYSVVKGNYSEYFEFTNELDSTLVLRKPLDFETLPNFTVTLRASDQGTPPRYSDTVMSVDVLDADDQNPRFAHEHYTAVLPQGAKDGTILEVKPEPISAIDQDLGINAPVQYTVAGEGGALVTLQRDSAVVAATDRLLTAAMPVTVVIKATQVDNPDRYALATLTISRAGGGPQSAPVRFTSRAYRASVGEDLQPGANILTLHTEPHRTADQPPLQFYVSDRSFLDKFAINSAGEVILRRPLDFETQNQYYYQVMVTDGVANDTSSINITVLNVNEWEPRFKYPQYEFRVEEPPDVDAGRAPGGRAGAGAGGLVPVGKLDVHDGDAPDTVSLTLRGAHANMFYINPVGELFMRQEALWGLNSSVLQVVATAVDSGSPPRQTSVPVIVHVSEKLMSRWAAAGAGAGRAGRGSAAVVGAFAAALTLLVVVVCLLLAYIYRNKRRPKQSTSPSPDKTSFPPASTKSLAPSGTLPPSSGPHSVSAPLPLGANSGSLLSVSAGASTILANSSSSLDLRTDTLPTSANGTRGSAVGRQSQRFPTKSKIAPLPPSCDPPADPNGVALMSDHLNSSRGRSGVAWPASTIPARVKKLSWDDTEAERNKGSGDSALHEASNPNVQDHLNLTVYF